MTVKLSTEMETDFVAALGEIQELNAMYYQCRSARLAGRHATFVSISNDTCSSFGKIVTVQSPQIGSLKDHCNIRETFHGSRVMRGNAVVNESLSCSFDPAKLVCISCAREHSVVGKDPVVVLFSDHNFVASLACEKEKCINVVRLENASLLDLLELLKELFSNVVLPEGSIFMFGSVSYLGRYGTSLYTRGWTEVVTLASDNCAEYGSVH
jgi:hypothetical protein